MGYRRYTHDLGFVAHRNYRAEAWTVVLSFTPPEYCPANAPKLFWAHDIGHTRWASHLSIGFPYGRRFGRRRIAWILSMNSNVVVNILGSGVIMLILIDYYPSTVYQFINDYIRQSVYLVQKLYQRIYLDGRRHELKERVRMLGTSMW